MDLKIEEIDSFLNDLREHNRQFVIGPLENYKIYYKPISGKHQIFLRKFFNVTRFKFLADAIVGWGLNHRTITLFYEAKRRKIPFLLMEDGFIRSLYTWVADVEPSLKSGISYIVDTKGFYFDGNIATDLEDLLNNYKLTDEQKQYSQNVIERIIENKITKYNNQPLDFNVENLGSRKNILIIDQSYGDMSLVRGGVPDSVFEKMLEDAVRDNPDYNILFKVHPDTLAKKKKTEFLSKLDENVILIDRGINPLAMIDKVEKVYVGTSQMGFEALLMGKEVHVYGMPFYAGWGLTKDKIDIPRRKRRLSVEEVFYIAYVLYSNYIDPVNNCKCDIDKAIDYICEVRNKNI